MSNSTSTRVPYGQVDGDYQLPKIETAGEKTWRMVKANPLVPIGMVAVLFSYRMAFLRSRERRQMDMNYWLRMRVVTQGFTLLAMSWSMNIWPQILPEFDRQHPGWLAPLPPVGIADTAEAQKIGFEERMREAEETHHAEVANAPPEKVVVRSQSLKVDGSGMQGGYWRWLRWGSSGSASEGSGSTPAAPSTAATVSTPHPPTPVATEKPRQGTSWLGGLMGGSSSDSEKDKQSR